MPTFFSLTFDAMNRSLVLVADKRIIAELDEVHVQKTADGSSFECSLVHNNAGNPVRLVASSSPEGRKMIERASGVETSLVPGFVEVSSGKETTQREAAVASSAEKPTELQEVIAKFFGYEQAAG